MHSANGLRREREMRGISLDEIAATTKIGTRLLRALEDEQFDLLPGGIFNKGYVRAYAKYVGIDEEKAVADYLQAAQEAAPGGQVMADQNASSRFERIQPRAASTGLRSPLPVVPILIVLVLLAGIAGGWRLYRERQLDRKQQAALTVARDTTLRASPPSPAPAARPLRQNRRRLRPRLTPVVMQDRRYRQRRASRGKSWHAAAGDNSHQPCNRDQQRCQFRGVRPSN